MELQKRNFIALLRGAVCPHTQPVLEEPDYSAILSLAEGHSVTGLLYPPLKKLLPMTDPILREMKKRSFTAATRESLQNKELGAIFAAFEEARISVLPLKGCEIKSLYPYPELRFMSDADLLVSEETEGSVRKVLEALGFVFHKVDAADTDVYVSPLGLNYEIHKSLEGEGFHEASREFSKGLMDRAPCREGFSYVRRLPPLEHYVYILIHFIKHFIYGGVGVRQLTDLYVCYGAWSLEDSVLEQRLRVLELWEFHKQLKKLWESWFEDAPWDDFTQELGEYILGSGVFGNESQRATDRILANGQGSEYFLARLFPPRETMVGFFPILRKCPILLPFLWIWRALRALLFRRHKLKDELKAVEHTDKDTLELRRQFYANCGLRVYDKI